jgi:hypothetical protein
MLIDWRMIYTKNFKNKKYDQYISYIGEKIQYKQKIFTTHSHQWIPMDSTPIH